MHARKKNKFGTDGRWQLLYCVPLYMRILIVNNNIIYILYYY